MVSFASFFCSFRSFGFSGCRSGSGGSSAAASRLVLLVPSGSSVFVGCAAGVDAAVVAACPSAVVVRASSRSRSALAARSVACVSAVVAGGGLWCSFPSAPCPLGLVPAASSSRCFAGFGSGSWASLALAVGLGCACVLVLPVGVAAPAWVVAGFARFGSRCWVRNGMHPNEYPSPPTHQELMADIEPKSIARFKEYPISALHRRNRVIYNIIKIEKASTATHEAWARAKQYKR